MRDNPGCSKVKLSELAGCKPAAGYKMVDVLKAKGWATEDTKHRNTVRAIDPKQAEKVELLVA